MSEYGAAEKVLKTMLSTLGFEVEVVTKVTVDGACMQIQSDQSELIIGKNGDRLEDLQYLVNRIIVKKEPNMARIKVDCEDYRKNQEAHLLGKVASLAEKVKVDGKSARTRPLNAYYRRIVHNAFTDDTEVKTSSPEGSSRFKRIQISKKES